MASQRKKIEKFIAETYGYSKFLVGQLREKHRFGDYRYPYCEELKGQRVYILANGPSLKDELVLLKSDEEFQKSPKFVVNFFVNSDYFKSLKPNFYCIADPAFFKTDKYVGTFKKINDEVSWSMSLYLPNWGVENVKQYFNNPLIKLIPVSPLLYKGYESLKYKYYKSGKGMPSYVNVTIMIEYILLNMGCKDIWLYGVDHSFLADLSVNDDNQLCTVDSHFYGEKKLRVINMKSDGRIRHMKDFVYDKYLTFLEHENMRGYADYLGARIVNCTKNSWIDSYVRLAQLEKDKA